MTVHQTRPRKFVVDDEYYLMGIYPVGHLVKEDKAYCLVIETIECRGLSRSRLKVMHPGYETVYEVMTE